MGEKTAHLFTMFRNCVDPSASKSTPTSTLTTHTTSDGASSGAESSGGESASEIEDAEAVSTPPSPSAAAVTTAAATDGNEDAENDDDGGGKTPTPAVAVAQYRRDSYNPPLSNGLLHKAIRTFLSGIGRLIVIDDDLTVSVASVEAIVADVGFVEGKSPSSMELE